MTGTISMKKLSRVFGFNKDREGLITRYLNEQKNWESHLKQTKKIIIKAGESKAKGLCLILGSGWWLDLPYEQLSEMFTNLIFIDITHPNQIVLKAKKFSNIELVKADISGTLSPIYEMFKKGDEFSLNNEFFPEVNTFGLTNNINPDFVVSLNILNQLPFFPKNFLIANNLVPEDQLNPYVKKIEQYHIDSLPKNKSCLITDYIQYEYDENNKLLKESNRLVADLPDNNLREEWIWDFDLSGNFINNRKVRFKVAALQV